MKPELHFDSMFDVVGQLRPYSQDEIKNEPMFFSAYSDFAYENGGIITRAFLRELHREWGADAQTAIIDSRVHMLMPGWYPCIPGWHLDDVPRTRSDGQPNHANPEYESDHLMVAVGDCSLTEFAVGHVYLEDVPVGGGVVYAKWHEEIERQLAASDEIERAQVKDGQVVAFDWQAFHRGMPATKDGWRFFIRASRNTKRKATNEIRKQVQVYMPAINAGW